MKKPLYKTTVVIWSEYGPCPSLTLEDLGREADEGMFYCSSVASELVADPEGDSAWDGTEFFTVGDDE